MRFLQYFTCKYLTHGCKMGHSSNMKELRYVIKLTRNNFELDLSG